MDLGEGKYGEVLGRLLPIGDQMPQYVASQLTLGRAAELAGDIPLAYSAFREIATRNQRAFQKLGELHPRALEIVSNRLQEAVRLQRLEEAEKQLSFLRSWAPSESVTLEGARAIAVARGDRRAELAAVKELAAQRPGERALVERRAELEMAVGDPSAGLQIIQGLADEDPDDPALAEKLAAAKFRWRVSLLPKDVQEVAALPELTKGDLAVLLYWLVPSVRYGRPTAGRIATDILDHPASRGDRAGGEPGAHGRGPDAAPLLARRSGAPRPRPCAAWCSCCPASAMGSPVWTTPPGPAKRRRPAA